MEDANETVQPLHTPLICCLIKGLFAYLVPILIVLLAPNQEKTPIILFLSAIFLFSVGRDFGKWESQ